MPTPVAGRMQNYQNELGQFLRAHRRALQPDPPGSVARRGGGLRRDDVAAAAGISTIYYARLEQGAKRNPSPAVVTALARALRLTGSEHEHLAKLAGDSAVVRGDNEWMGPAVASTLSLLISAVDTEPAYVVGPGGKVIMSNALAQVLCPAYMPGTSAMRWLFTAPQARATIGDWDRIACETVARLRHDAEKVNPPRPDLQGLVEELLQISPEFEGLWAQHRVAQAWRGPITYHHELLGSLKFERVALLVAGAPLYALHVLRPKDSSCQLALRKLVEDQ